VLFMRNDLPRIGLGMTMMSPSRAVANWTGSWESFVGREAADVGDPVASQNPTARIHWWRFERLAITCAQAMLTNGTALVDRSEPRTRTALLLESIAFRHQIAALERSRTRRPCFRRIYRLFWIVLSRGWSGWSESLVIVQPETVLRWRRNGWSALERYRSRGHWRGGRPRVSSEVGHLITRIARENFLWGAPRIHGELLKLGFNVSQSPRPPYRITCRHQARRPTQSWQTLLRNQASAFGQYPEERSREYAGLHGQSCWAKLMESAAAQVAAVGVGLWRGLGRQQPALKARRISLQVLRPVRLSRYAPIASAGRIAWWSPGSAQ
jgi:hypothetical protein